MNKEETMAVLEKHFFECVRYWERTLNTDSDLDKEPYIRAIKELPITNPCVPQGEKLNEEWVAEFRKYRLMDVYGKEWKKYGY